MEKHIFTKDYVKSVVSLCKERATFVKDFWTIAPYLFVAPKDFEAFGISRSATDAPASGRPVDPRAKVYDDTLTAPFLAKDVDKFWKEETVGMVRETGEFLKEYAGEWSVEGVETALEEYIKGKEWPMGKVMNALRLALAGSASGLGIADIVSRIGKKDTTERIAYAIERLGR